MAKKIYKYPINTTDSQSVAMPIDYQILSIDTQNEVPCIWALIDNTLPLTLVKIRIYGTGHEINESDNLQYIGSYQLQRGLLVFHVFEDKIN